MRLIRELHQAVINNDQSKQFIIAHQILSAAPPYPSSLQEYAHYVLKRSVHAETKKGRIAGQEITTITTESEMVLASGLFERNYYSKVSGIHFASEIAACIHYLTEGWRQGHNPSDAFDTHFYLSSYPDVRRSEIQPLLHYLRQGREEQRCPLPLLLHSEEIHQDYYDSQYVERHRSQLTISNELPKMIAFYLPQFHEIEENNCWWGDGFTEWTNVRKAEPLFAGHQQPQSPGDLGYYDLSCIETLQRQSQIASSYGIHGFCIYFYWFNGKTLLEKPLRLIQSNPSLAINYCLCWANENWTRTWDGLENDILVAQVHSTEDDLAFIAHLSQYLQDPRYIRIDDKPLLVVYRPSMLPDPSETARRWRQWCRDEGIGEIVIAKTQAFDSIDPHSIGFDLAIEFTPNGMNPTIVDPSSIGLPGDFEGSVYNWVDLMERSREYCSHGYPLARCICPGWDNTPRKGKRANILVGNSPRLFVEWVENAVKNASLSTQSDNLVFINAWNEWAEGAVLEPTRAQGYAYLEALRQGQANAYSQLRLFDGNERVEKRSKCALVIHAYYPEVLSEIFNYLESLDCPAQFAHILVTTPPEKLEICREYLGMHDGQDAMLLCVENRGRDIRPFLEMLPWLIKARVKYVCKIHTKKSPHRKDGEQWRRAILDSLLSSNTFQVIRTLDADPDCRIGVLAPKGHLLPMSAYLGSNGDAVLRLGTKLGFSIPEIKSSTFAAGSMFWANLNAILPIISLVDPDQFQYEVGQLDGTLAHAIERVFSLVSLRSGYKTVELDESTRCGYIEMAEKPVGVFPFNS